MGLAGHRVSIEVCGPIEVRHDEDNVLQVNLHEQHAPLRSIQRPGLEA